MGRIANRHLIVFTRFPVAGTTKTRLIPVLGASGAALLQRSMAERTLERVSRAHLLPEPSIEIRFEGGDRKRLQAWLGAGYFYRPQEGHDLGARMAAAFENAFRDGADQVALVGTDIPGLQSTVIECAFHGLAKADVVFGPASDGGYYLIGMSREIYPAGLGLFKDIDWGTARVLSASLDKAASLGLRTRLLEELADVDNPEDLPVWEQALRTPSGKA